MRQRENVCIRTRDLEPSVDVLVETRAAPEDGLLLRTLYSLMGTRREDSALRHLLGFVGSASHPGYASVGMVEETGSRDSRFDAGDIVVMPACFSTYVALSRADLSGVSRYLLQRVPPGLDTDKATFAPLVALAVYLSRRMTNGGPVIFVGCGLLGGILLQVLRLENNPRPIVCVADGEDELDCQLILSRGASAVLDCEQALDAVGGKAQSVFLLSASKRYSCITQTLLLPQGELISAIDPASPSAQSRRPPWLVRDTLMDALSLLRDGKLALRDLVAQHVHAEAITQTLGAIRDGRYRGRALIYDW